MLRPPRMRDARVWSEIRIRNQQWLEQWEPTSSAPWPARNSPAAWRPMVGAFRKAGRSGQMAPFMIVFGGRLVGQISVSNIVHGALRSCTVGYWVDSAAAGRSVVPTALAMVIDHCFSVIGLHRVEVDIRPENAASLRVVAKLGLRREGYYERFLDIGGAWRDHVAFAVTAEELKGATMLSRLPSLPIAPG
ncbi:GNAT family N-acetyltransferase [Jatrophihabitans sp. GAS493]|uniref:GNAT family N-acetyltransferase n=1 Tax=Jatrophihabitans sp. GAS493 TaxID=1907575 RepID=UPI001F53A70F|nr:GNAT family protein [Jatrophihabitans sp. GAS493]